MARSSLIRASDADRDAVAERLRQASVEGRLEPWELEERLEKALRARTYGDLDPLVRDIPGRSAARGRPPVSVSAAGVALAIAVRIVVLLVVLAALLAAVAVSAAWWLIGLVVWLGLRSRRACAGPPRARRVY